MKRTRTPAVVSSSRAQQDALVDVGMQERTSSSGRRQFSVENA